MSYASTCGDASSIDVEPHFSSPPVSVSSSDTVAVSKHLFDSAGMNRRLYRTPPVVEAVVDIHVARSAPVTLAELGRFYESESELYPSRQGVHSAALRIDPKSGVVLQHEAKLLGYRLTNSLRSCIAQARTNGFAFSRLAPYVSWEEWKEEAHRLWDVYRSTVRPDEVNRIAVRYINRVDIPLTRGKRMRDYFTVYPQLPECLPGAASSFLMQLELAIPDVESGRLVLNMGRVDPPTPNVVSVLLDLDLFRQVAMPSGDDRVWEIVEELHERENTIFESCITDDTRSLFE